MHQEDIAALATPPGEGGIAILRLSGSGVIEKAGRIFKPYRAGVEFAQRKGYSLTLGWIIDEQGENIDQVLLGLMRNPHSYTGEDVVEINCHGGTLAARRCLERVMSQEVRLAEPGEFTRRAYLNGRLDALQAEAVIDVIRAKTDKALSLAMGQLQGRTSREMSRLENELMGLNAEIEASIDFPDEVGEPDYEKIRSQIKGIAEAMEVVISAGKRGEVYRDGINVAISGKPNVGKSSLLNTLLRKEKAIVTNIPGTTRDVIEEYINIRGIPIKLMDTAGIRETRDVVERLGVEKSRQAMQTADLIILLLDVESGLNDDDFDIFRDIQSRKMIILVNKNDLADKRIQPAEMNRYFPGKQVIWGSVKQERGIEELEAAIETMALAGNIGSDGLEIMLNLRQKNALLRARNALMDSLANLNKMPLDCLAVDIWGALESLGEISGRNLKDEVIDRMFHDFCIGK